MAYPEKYHIDALRALRGDAKVTYPYDNAPNRRIERVFGVPRGTSLAAYAVLQDEEYAGAVLVEQYQVGGDAQAVEIFQAFEDLPGPWIPGTRYDNDLGPVQTKRRAVLTAPEQAASLTFTGKTTFEARGNSSLVSWEINEAWSDGTGSDDANPAYPIKSSSFYDKQRGTVDRSTQLTATPGEASLLADGDVITQITYEGTDQFQQARKVTEVFTLPAPLVPSGRLDEDGAPITITDHVKLSGSITTSEAVVESELVKVTKERDNEVYATEHIERRDLPGPELVRYDIDTETGLTVTITTQLVAKPADRTGYGETAGQTVEYQPISAVHGRKVIAAFDTGTLPVSRTEIKLAPYTYPSLIFGVTGTLVESTDGAGRVLMNWQRRAARTRVVSHQVEITYGTEGSLALPGSYFDPELQNLIYDGLFLNANERNVLNDAISLPFTTGADNPQYPLLTETMAFSASPLSATDYVALIDTLAIVNATKERWKFGLWRLTIIKVPLR